VWFGELDEPHTEGQLRVRALDPSWSGSRTGTSRGDPAPSIRARGHPPHRPRRLRARCRDHGRSKPHSELLAERLHAQGVETETLFSRATTSRAATSTNSTSTPRRGSFFLERLLTFLRRRLGGPAQPEPEASTKAS
jgi:hypothetical protein